MGGTVGCPEYRGDVYLAQAAIFGEKSMIRILPSMSTHFYRGVSRGGSSEIRSYILLRWLWAKQIPLQTMQNTKNTILGVVFCVRGDEKLSFLGFGALAMVRYYYFTLYEMVPGSDPFWMLPEHPQRTPD